MKTIDQEGGKGHINKILPYRVVNLKPYQEIDHMKIKIA